MLLRYIFVIHNLSKRKDNKNEGKKKTSTLTFFIFNFFIQDKNYTLT